MWYRILFFLAVLPSMGIYRGCGEDATQISHANQRDAYDLKTSRAIALQGGWRDTLLVGDDPESQHGMSMRYALVERFGIPEHHLSWTLGRWGGTIRDGNRGLNDLTSGEYESLRKSTRVVHLPLYRPLESDIDVQNVHANPHILFVTATGNTYIHENSEHLAVRMADNWDVWNPEHPVWIPEIFNPSDLSYAQTAYDNIQTLVQGEQTLFATSAQVCGENGQTAFDSGVQHCEPGEVVPHRGVMRCGTLKDACFAILPPQPTSSASARLAAMAFYLAQLYPTTEEVVDILQQCAIDVGEPGVDIEYGHGIATLLCAPVIEKEVDIILSYSSAPSARSLRNVLHALRDEPEFVPFVRAMFLQ